MLLPQKVFYPTFIHFSNKLHGAGLLLAFPLRLDRADSPVPLEGEDQAARGRRPGRDVRPLLGPKLFDSVV